MEPMQTMLHQSVAAYQDLRARSAPLPAGIAPPTSSFDFRIRARGSGTPGKCWDHRLSTESHSRYASTLKASTKVKGSDSIISLGTARPAGQFFPWDFMALGGPRPTGDDRQSDIPNTTNDAPAQRAAMSCSRGEAAYDLDIALNYGYTAGSPQLLRFITEHIEMIHHPPYDEWETCLTSGSTAAIEMLLRMLCNRGDWIVAEEHTYSGFIEAAKPLGLNILGVRMDGIGLVPEDLDSKLRAWDTSAGAIHKKPRTLYTIPSGQNPTGRTQAGERRRAIYRVAEEHDLIIIEDDPYYLLQLGGPGAGLAPMTQDTYLSALPPSYLSLDKSGRVLRLDSTSKILAPGLRCGWLTGCSQLVAKFLNHTEFSTVSPSGPSQVMLYKLLDENWGHAGFIAWLTKLSWQYRQRLNTLIDACEIHLPRGEVCSWTAPTVGMFLWMRIDWVRHPLAARLGACPDEHRASFFDVEDRVLTRAKVYGVQISKGSWFAVGEPSTENMYFRLTFAAAPYGALGSAIERLGRALEAEFKPSNKHLTSIVERST